MFLVYLCGPRCFCNAYRMEAAESVLGDPWWSFWLSSGIVSGECPVWEDSFLLMMSSAYVIISTSLWLSVKQLTYQAVLQPLRMGEVIVWAPSVLGSDLFFVGHFISIWDKAYNGDVICKFKNDIWAVLCYTVICKQSIDEGWACSPGERLCWGWERRM